MPRPIASTPTAAAPIPIPALVPVDKLSARSFGVLVGAVAVAGASELEDAGCDGIDDAVPLAVADVEFDITVEEVDASVVESVIDEVGDGVARY